MYQFLQHLGRALFLPYHPFTSRAVWSHWVHETMIQIVKYSLPGTTTFNKHPMVILLLLRMRWFLRMRKTMLSCTLSTERKGNPKPRFPWQQASISVPSCHGYFGLGEAGDACLELAFGQSSSVLLPGRRMLLLY